MEIKCRNGGLGSKANNSMLQVCLWLRQRRVFHSVEELIRRMASCTPYHIVS